MAYLIGQLSVLLAIAALFGGGLAGWSWHCIRNRDKWAAKDSQRARLREELLGFVGVDFGDPLPPLPAPLVDTGELEDLRAHLAAAEERARAQEAACGDHVSKIASLEMELSSLRASLDNDAEAARFLALEESLRASQDKASDLERRAAELEDLLNQTSAPAPAEDGVDVAAMRWRIRDLEARLAKVDSDAAIARIVGPEPAPAPQPDQEDALNRQRWQARYLQARVNYLEELSRQTPKAEPAPMPVVAAPPVDEEAESRKRWRQRYLEARVAWLEGRARDALQARQGLVAEVGARDQRISALEEQLRAPAPEDPRLAELAQRAAELEGALAAARSEGQHGARRVAELEAQQARLEARIAELEAQPAPEPVREVDPEAGSLRWRSRYLDSRVRFLEQTLATTQRQPPAPPAPPRDDKFAPLQPAETEIKPIGMPAPRDGARDDLRLIAGVDPRVESTLNSLGVYHFDQIAAWTPQNVAWIERYLAFRGRIGREDWVAQAQALAGGAQRPVEAPV